MMTRVCLAVFAIAFSVQLRASTNLKEFFERCLPDCLRSQPDVLRLEAPSEPEQDDEYLLLEGDASQAEPNNACVVCLDAGSNSYSTACGHLAMCNGCAGTIKSSANSNCPICRKEITTLKTVVVATACALCKIAVPNTMNEACNHVCMCNQCVDEQIVTLKQCPSCNAPITRYIELFLPQGSL